MSEVLSERFSGPKANLDIFPSNIFLECSGNTYITKLTEHLLNYRHEYVMDSISG